MSDHKTVPLCTLAAFCGFLAFLGTCFCPAPAPASTVLNSKMSFDSPQAGDLNGWQLDVHAGTAIIGGPYGGIDNTKGWAQIFYNDPSNGWEYQDTLTSTDPALGNNSRFGYGVAIGQNMTGQDMAVVSALQNKTVYVFRRPGMEWIEDDMEGLTSETTQFGIDVGVSDGQIIVGSSGNAAYIYTIGEVEGEAAWVYESLTVEGTTISFGGSVGISGEDALVGDPGTSTAHFFRFDEANEGNKWGEEQAFTESGGSFGSSARISGDYAIVGDPTGLADDGSIGLAVIYHRDGGGTWTKEDTLTNGDIYGSDKFGSSVDIGENYAIVGAPEAWGDESGTPCGVSYLFQRGGSTWTEIKKLEPGDGFWSDKFGLAVAIKDGDTADFIIGAPHHDSNTGAVYTRSWMPGDADRDDDVDEFDAAILAANWLDGPDVDWGDGDFNEDNIVDAADATLMAANWHFGVGPGVSVPEPATLVLMAFGGLCLLATACRMR